MTLEALPSPPPTNPLTATFVDPAVEATFQREHIELDVRRYTRFSLIVSTVSFMGYGINDAFFLSSPVREQAWFARFVCFTPIAVAIIASTYTAAFGRLHQRLMLLYGLSINGVVLFIASIALATNPPAFFVYSSYAVLFVTLGPFIARMNVATQILYTALTALLFLVLATSFAHATTVVTVSTVMTLLSMGFVGALVSRQGELQSRQLFAQRQLIAAQMVELDVERAKSEGLLLNILPRAIADRLKSSTTAIADGFPAVTVLFADMVGFTKLSAQLSPEELVGGLNEMFSAFDDLADEHGIDKIKTIGDAYMAVAGLHGEPDHAARIADMALGMVERVAAMNRFATPLSVRVGLHSGPAVAGVIGKKKFIYDVWGDTVNVASRMESHSEPGRVQITEATRALLGDAFELEPRGEIDVKGKGRMPTWFLLRRLRRMG